MGVEIGSPPKSGQHSPNTDMVPVTEFWVVVSGESSDKSTQEIPKPKALSDMGFRHVQELTNFPDHAWAAAGGVKARYEETLLRAQGGRGVPTNRREPYPPMRKERAGLADEAANGVVTSD